MSESADFDWRTQTRRRGTCSRVGQFVLGTCARCGDANELVYEIPDQDVDELWCASCYRWWASHVEAELPQACDRCGRVGSVLRDPLTRKNLYMCVHCRAEEGLAVPVNRWATVPRASEPLGKRERAECAAAGRGTECRGEVKWRGAFKMSLCNKHAGKQGVGPNG